MSMDVKFSPSTRFALSQDQLATEVADGAIALNLETGEYYSLNPTAHFIWKLMDQPTTFESLVDALLDSFDVNPTRARDDLSGALQEMLDARIVRVLDSDVDL